jgi:hypothetical protein
MRRFAFLPIGAITMRFGPTELEKELNAGLEEQKRRRILSGQVDRRDLRPSEYELAHIRPPFMAPHEPPPRHQHRNNYIDNLRLLLGAVNLLPENRIWCGQEWTCFPEYFLAMDLIEIACTLPALNARGLYWDRFKGTWGPFAHWIGRDCLQWEFHNMVLREFFGRYSLIDYESADSERMAREVDPYIYLFGTMGGGSENSWNEHAFGIQPPNGKAYVIAKIKKAMRIQARALDP